MHSSVVQLIVSTPADRPTPYPIEASVDRPFPRAYRPSSAVSNERRAQSLSDNRVLCERLIHQDPGALEYLYDLTSGRAFGLAYRILNDGPAAEDVVQDVFLWVWNNAHRVDPDRGNVESLLMTLVHRRSIDALRSRARRERLSASQIHEITSHRFSDPVEAASFSAARERIAGALDNLNADQRRAIELAYFWGMTHQEIAEETGAPIGTVKSRLRLGMDRLRSLLGMGD